MDDCECNKCEEEEEESEDLAQELADTFKFLQPNVNQQDEDNSASDEKDSVHFKIRDYQRQEKQEESPRLLDPDHPLLEKFQKALKDHLEKQIDSLNTEIFELETGAKKKNDARETIGVEAYEMQQTVCQQQLNIEKCMEELQTLTAARIETLQKLEEIENLHKKEHLELTEFETKEMQLRNEIKQMDLLLHQMTTWANEMESDLLVNQRMSEKTRKDKIKLADDKRELDIIVYKLMSEVWRLENELESIEMQMRVKEQDRERLAEAVIQSNTDIEAIESEHRCLMHSWHSVIVAIENRDKHYNAVYKDYQESLEKVQSTIAEINKVKKLCKAEMIQNENLCLFKTRVETDIRACGHQLELEIRKKNQLERELHQTGTIIDQIDTDIQKLNLDLAIRKRELKIVVRDFDEYSSEKIKLEEEILLKLQDQITNDKASAYLRKLVTKSKEKNLDTEMNLSNTENQNAKVINMIENQNEINLALSKRVDEIENEITMMENELKSTQNEIKKCDNAIKKKEQEYDLINKKIEARIQREQGSTLSPQEIKVKTQEKNIIETVEYNKKLQKFWLREQGHICQLSEQRQNQLKEMNLLKKQTMILHQRNLKVNDELESYIKTESDINRSVENLYNKISVLNDELCKKKGTADCLKEHNTLHQVDFTTKLKDLELESLSVEDSIEEMENEKVRLSEELIEKNRVRLAWEKKLLMVLETKENMRQEKVGELGNIKSEIHRMKVRYAQLRKAQDKLISDMEHCVLRRDTIYTVAEAHEKRKQDGSISRMNFLRKLEDLKNKYKQTESDQEVLTKKLGSVKQLETSLEEEYANLHQEMEDLQKVHDEWFITMEKAVTQKNLNLNILVLRQRKLKIYTEISIGRKPPLMYRTESSMIAEYDKQKDLNNKLMSILDSTTKTFPSGYHIFERLYNTLKLPYLFI